MTVGDRAGTRLNRNQVRWVEATYTHVDELLQRIERLTDDHASPFERERRDVGAGEAALLRGMVARARARMLASLDRLGIARPAPRLSARWSIETSLHLIEVSLSELDARTLRGYGGIAEADAAEVAILASELREVAAQGRALLHPKQGEGLREALAAIPGAVGGFLRAAEEVSRTHGVADARPLIAAIAERVTSADVAVGVFGRVSAGKSSLINALLGAPLLPVGATPVTAVPVQIQHGEPGVMVHYLDGRAASLRLDRLADVATEAGNADNYRGVRSIEVSTPQLADGLQLLDTPGVGSLSQSGPALAYASLPRCDLGVVLVPTGAAVGREDIALVAGLRDAGIPVQVLLSKADQLTAAECAASAEYLQRELARTIGPEAPTVHTVSVAPAAADRFAQWRDEVLGARIEERRRTTSVAIARRLQALLHVLDAGLAGREAVAGDARFDRQRRKFEASKAINATADALETSAKPLLAAAEDAVVNAWRQRQDANAAVRSHITAHVSAALTAARTHADSVVASPSEAASDLGGRLPPLFDPPWLDTLPVPAAPTLLDRLAPRTRARRYLRPLWRALDDALSTFSPRMKIWAQERLAANAERVSAVGTGDAPPRARALAPLATLLDGILADSRAAAGASVDADA